MRLLLLSHLQLVSLHQLVHLPALRPSPPRLVRGRAWDLSLAKGLSLPSELLLKSSAKRLSTHGERKVTSVHSSASSRVACARAGPLHRTLSPPLHWCVKCFLFLWRDWPLPLSLTMYLLLSCYKHRGGVGGDICPRPPRFILSVFIIPRSLCFLVPFSCLIADLPLLLSSP